MQHWCLTVLGWKREGGVQDKAQWVVTDVGRRDCRALEKEPRGRILAVRHLSTGE